jgi:hypothetical protein
MSLVKIGSVTYIVHLMVKIHFYLYYSYFLTYFITCYIEDSTLGRFMKILLYLMAYLKPCPCDLQFSSNMKTFIIAHVHKICYATVSFAHRNALLTSVNECFYIPHLLSDIVKTGYGNSTLTSFGICEIRENRCRSPIFLMGLTEITFTRVQ